MNLENARIVKSSLAGGDYRILVIEAPGIASMARPGQFIHLRIPGAEFVLRRPFSIYRAEKGKISVLFKIVGSGTRQMERIEKGSRISVMGPLGNHFPQPRSGEIPLLVAGGYGVAPLSFFARTLKTKGELFVGGRSKKDILCLGDFRKAGWKIHVTTEDGSLGRKGLVTAPLDERLASLAAKSDRTPVLYACGPDGLLKAICRRAAIADCKAWVSMDRHMGCGVGACLACVHRILDDDGVEHWGRVCKEGPVFESGRIVWPEQKNGSR